MAVECFAAVFCNPCPFNKPTYRNELRKLFCVVMLPSSLSSFVVNVAVTGSPSNVPWKSIEFEKRFEKEHPILYTTGVIQLPKIVVFLKMSVSPILRALCPGLSRLEVWQHFPWASHIFITAWQPLPSYVSTPVLMAISFSWCVPGRNQSVKGIHQFTNYPLSSYF